MHTAGLKPTPVAPICLASQPAPSHPHPTPTHHHHTHRRCIVPMEPLSPYDWSLAMGRWLLAELEVLDSGGLVHALSLLEGGPASRGAVYGADDENPLDSSTIAAVAAAAAARSAGSVGGREVLVLCIPGAQRAHYTLVTNRRFLHIHARGTMWAPWVRWSAALCDVESVSCSGATLSIVAHRAQRARLGSLQLPGQAEGRGGGGGGGGFSLVERWTEGRRARGLPFSYLAAECEGQEAAERLEKTVKALVARTPKRVSFAASTQIIMSSC
jgi:hypothetical protein